MAFFDKLGEKISSKSKEVAQKAKDLTDVTKLNAQVSAEEKTINELYFKIGKAYYESHCDGPVEPAFEELFGQVESCLLYTSVRRREGGDLPPEILFDGHVLDDGFHHQLAAVKACLICGVGDAPLQCLGLGMGGYPAFHGLALV